MILDATAGNRTMWRHKSAPNIIYIDIQKRLHVKPTLYADNTKTPFLSGAFDTIFYDPPHIWGGKDNAKPVYPKEIKRWKSKHEPFAFTYYGWDIYKTRMQLIAHIYRAQKEFQRILRPDGLLWLKWNETSISLKRILVIFGEWHVLLQLPLTMQSHTKGVHQTFWVCLAKKERKDEQLRLT